MAELAVALAPADPSFFLSAPSSPRPFGDPAGCYYYTSAPASPSRAAAIYTDLYGPEEKPGSGGGGDDDEVPEFSFCFPTLPIAAADELFEEGIIRTVMPSWVESGGGGAPRTVEDGLRGGRGRRTLSSSSGAAPRVRRASASLSSLGGGGCEGELPRPPSSSQAASALAKGGGSKKWKFSDLFLFRSASEGRATGRGSKDPLRKYTLPPPPSSTKRANGGGSTRRGSGSSPSAHEIYYSANRAAAEEQKRKQMTPLAYQRHGLFGYLRDNPAIHSITKGLGGSSLFSRRQP